jgi:hypothetical protein
MALFTKKTQMQKLEAELAALKARAKLLDTKRTAVQNALDSALAARQAHMLDGDLDDTKTGARLQAAVDSTASVLAGFDTSITAQAALIADTEAKLAAERLAADRQAASEALATQTDAIEKQLAPWLARTRDLAAAAALVGPVSFETDQVGAYLRNAASEIELALAVSISNLRGSVAAILAGHQPIPRASVATTRTPPPDES